MARIIADALVAAGGTLVLMNRLEADDGDALTQADVSAIEYTLYELQPDGTLEAVTGHSAVALTVADTIFDTLQTDAPWDSSEDATGYNFKHTPDVSENAAFPNWGRRYLLCLSVTLQSGQPIVWAWRIRTPQP